MNEKDTLKVKNRGQIELEKLSKLLPHREGHKEPHGVQAGNVQPN